MVDELAVTNEIWRSWDEQKVKPPMTWAELRKFVEESIKIGADPYVLRPWSEEKRMEIFKVFRKEIPTRAGPYAETRLPWPNPEPEAVVELAEIPTFSPALLSKVETAWETKKSERFWEWIIEPTDKGVLVGLRGASRPHELFTPDIIQELHKGRRKGYPRVTGFMSNLYFEGEESRAQARYILQKHGIYPEDGPDFSFIDVEDADYVLELLSAAGFDTSKILVERG
jgi:hypothetical protein